jgi:hypothetical protein
MIRLTVVSRLTPECPDVFCGGSCGSVKFQSVHAFSMLVAVAAS